MKYNRAIKALDEPHSPIRLEKMLKSKTLNRGKFLTENHFFSYYLQMKTIYELQVKTVLEIGPGENFIQMYMSTLGIKYDTMDVMADSNPTYLTSLAELNTNEIKTNYEMVCAFQMLEHLPYEEFEANLNKMKNLSSKYVFISLPYSCNKFALGLNLQFGQKKKISKSLQLIFPTNKPNRRYREEYKHEFPWAVHYFEIGREGFALKKVLSDIEKTGLRVIDTFHSQNAFHYFILAEK